MTLKSDWQTDDVFTADDANDVANEVNANTTALGGKASTAHTHELAAITDVTASAAELNFVDGVTSPIQGQLDGKAATSHTHSATEITSGTLGIARIPTGTSSTTVCVGNDTRLSDQRTPSDSSVTSAKIVDGSIVNADVNASAGIALSKLATGRVAGYVNGTATSLDIDEMSETQWAAVTTPVTGRTYLVFED